MSRVTTEMTQGRFLSQSQFRHSLILGIIFCVRRKVKDHPTQYSSDGSITVSDVMINVTGDDGDDTKQVLVSWSHQVFSNCCCKLPKFSDTHQLYCNLPKIQTKRFYHDVIPPDDDNGIANSEDPDQSLGLHCLSENLG